MYQVYFYVNDEGDDEEEEEDEEEEDTDDDDDGSDDDTDYTIILWIRIVNQCFRPCVSLLFIIFSVILEYSNIMICMNMC